MNTAPHPGSPLKPMGVAWATASSERGSTSRAGQDFMTKIKNGMIVQRRDVKNEGTSGDMYENKGREKMKKGTSGDVDENTKVNQKSGRSLNVIERKGERCWVEKSEPKPSQRGPHLFGFGGHRWELPPRCTGPYQWLSVCGPGERASGNQGRGSI